MAVAWHKLDGRVKHVESAVVPASKLLEKNWDKDLVASFTSNKVEFNIDIKPMLQPLGDFWRVMYRNEETGPIRNALGKYWDYKGVPKVHSDAIVTELDSKDYATTIRSKLVNEGGEQYVSDISQIVKDINETVDYDRLVVGTDGSISEFQFLNASKRLELAPGDFADYGLFVRVNGNVQVSPGVNRLVCTNGLVERMNLWEADNYRFDKDMLNRASRLLKWFKSTKDIKINTVRKLSVALNNYPGFVKDSLWEEWAQKIELKELTWFDVIDGLTRNVNNVLNNTRYEVLAVPERINAVLDKATCPVCSASVNNGNGHKH